MRILLAGGAGFIGSHLASRVLDQGHHVVIVDNLLTGRRSNLARLQAGPGGRLLEVVIGDVCRCRLPAGRFDVVLHLASAASPRDYLRYPLETLQAGSVATHRLLECSHRWKARFLLASTSEVYGDPQIHPQPEDYWGHVNPVGVRAVYDEAKRYAEAVASAYARHHGTRVRIARIFNTYGPGMRPDDGRVIPTLIVQALRGEALTVYGDGTQTRSYCYVDDLVAGLQALLWSEVEGPVNLGCDEEYAVRETAERILAYTGSQSRIEFQPLPADDPRVRRPDLRKAIEALHWVPRVRFEEGLKRTVADLAERVRDGELDRSRGVRTRARRSKSPLRLARRAAAEQALDATACGRAARG